MRGRGANVLIGIDFSERKAPTANGNKCEKLGRNPERINERNRKLLLRFYYHSAMHKRLLDETIALLAVEFDISENTIVPILKRCATYVTKLRNQPPTIAELKKKYPYMAWETPAKKSNKRVEFIDFK